MTLPVQTETVDSSKTNAADARAIHRCDFQKIGRLSNEHARALMAMHGPFTHRLGEALDVFLSTAVGVKLLNIDQFSVREYMGQNPFLVAPLSLGTTEGHPLIECDEKFICPLIEHLMGGTGAGVEDRRDLTEIDEEVVRDVLQLIAAEAESTWPISNLSVSINRRIGVDQIQSLCGQAEKLVSLQFGVTFSNVSGSFKLLLPSSFVSALLRQQSSRWARGRGLRQFPKVPIREKLFDCEIEVCAELAGLEVSARDLVALQPGSILKFRAPIGSAGVLTTGTRSIFESVPVRSGQHRAAQLGKRVAQSEWNEEPKHNG